MHGVHVTRIYIRSRRGGGGYPIFSFVKFHCILQPNSKLNWVLQWRIQVGSRLGGGVSLPAPLACKIGQKSIAHKVLWGKNNVSCCPPPVISSVLTLPILPPHPNFDTHFFPVQCRQSLACRPPPLPLTPYINPLSI